MVATLLLIQSLHMVVEVAKATQVTPLMALPVVALEVRALEQLAQLVMVHKDLTAVAEETLVVVAEEELVALDKLH
jgi:hypothetical protein